MTLPQPERISMPERRLSVIRECQWEGHAFVLDIGFYPGPLGYDMGTPGEVFADRPKTDPMGAQLSDACTVISLALQHGITVEALAKSLATVPDVWGEEGATKPASPIGVILAEVAAEIAEQRA